jgi:fructose-1,6-bisphosphatase I
LINLTGLAGASNATGDDQKKLDVIGNDLFISAMRSCGRVRVLVSEEEEECIIFDEFPGARYAVRKSPVRYTLRRDCYRHQAETMPKAT